MRREDLAFFGFQFRAASDLRTLTTGSPEACAARACAAFNWISNVRALAGQISTKTGWRTSVALYTPCVAESAGPLFRISGEPRVAIRSQSRHPLRLRVALRRLNAWSVETRGPYWRGPMFLNLLKWTAVSAEWARLAVVLDVDMEPFPVVPPLVGRSVAVAARWVDVLSCAKGRNESLFSFSDTSSPVHGALLILKPSLGTFREGVSLLVPNGFNVTHGWGGVGPPRTSVPRNDASRVRMTSFANSSAWNFVGVAHDQGFFFHMYGVLHERRADLAWGEGCAGGVAAKAPLNHYVGGGKPELWLRSSHMCNVSGRSLFFGHLVSPRSTLVQASRVLVWAHRTRDEVRRLEANVRNATSETAARDLSFRLRACASHIERGLACFEAGIREARRETRATIRNLVTKATREGTIPGIGGKELAYGIQQFL